MKWPVNCVIANRSARFLSIKGLVSTYKCLVFAEYLHVLQTQVDKNLKYPSTVFKLTEDDPSFGKVPNFLCLLLEVKKYFQLES